MIRSPKSTKAMLELPTANPKLFQSVPSSMCAVRLGPTQTYQYLEVGRWLALTARLAVLAPIVDTKFNFCCLRAAEVCQTCVHRSLATSQGVTQRQILSGVFRGG